VWEGTISGFKTHDMLPNALVLTAAQKRASCASEKALFGSGHWAVLYLFAFTCKGPIGIDCACEEKPE